MFKKYLLFTLLIFTNFIFSQNRQGNFQGMQSNGKLSGKIIDAQTNQIIEYCNVVLFSYRDSSMVNGTITDREGKFTLSNLRPGMYFLRASYIGYDNQTIDSIRITPNKPEIDLGIIALDEKTIELSNVVVTGEKEVIINNLDKKVINVEKDLTNVGGTAVDVVQNIPSVTVDADGNVSYRGNQNIRILIDGKPSELLGLGSGDVLSNIPASQIESIELVTNPSARYDPEGTGGILNIVLKKRINGGLNGNISLTGGTGDKFNGSLNFNYKLPNVNFFASIDSRIHNADNNGNSYRTNNINNTLSYLDQLSNGTFNHFGHNFTAGLDITPDNYNTYTFSLRYRKFGFDTESLVKTSNLNSQSQLTRYFERSSNAERRMNALQYTLSYKRTFDTKGAELTTDVILSDFKMKRDENFNQLNFDNSLNPIENLLQKGLSDNKNLQWTIQSNYINPIEDLGRIETGFKVTLKNFNSKNDYLNYDNNSGNWLNDITRKTDFDYKENVYAVYGIYSNKISDFQYQIGIRAEQADVKGTENLTSSTFTNDYFSIYPTVHLVQSLPDQQEVQLSYSRRVERPNNRQLNPYVDRSDSLNISYGNPELKPEYINSIELGYSRIFGKTALTSSIFYRNTNDAITNYTIVNDNGITETTWRNLAKNLSYGLELTLSSSLFDWFRTNTSFTYFKNEFEGLNISNSDYSWLAKMNNTFMLSKDFNFQINLNYNAPTIMGQSKMKEQFATDIAMKKDFLDGQLSLTFRVSDLFNTRKWESETIGQNFITSSYRKMESRIAYLGISYRLSPNNNRERERRPKDEEGMDEF
ncbi:Outer membrane receptor protein [Ignavibacterium album JCM 16511]|uniref:Outer membrane receptor protein n=1 Tax=Ignavibacterium album (strain DSM 19864 / JCM 16511 / NBRC 101810 / Mat9-16) TaxID=945713 RepID=I0AME1_IGNAJ|nr:TonB-dependent receptor [Ignavibacterium album]AFH50148.1 Outer membrane receptor protein [Ignavibacterium album JCM 16511]